MTATIAGLLWLAALTCWIASAYFMIRMAMSVRSDVELPRSIRWNRFNVLLAPSLLTDIGRMYRRRHLQSLAAFILIILIGIVFGTAIDR